MKKMYFIVLFLVCTISTYAQLNEGLYDKDKGDSPMEEFRGNQSDIMNDRLYDRIMSNRRNFDIHVPVQREGGIQIDYGNSGTTTTHRTSSGNRLSKTKHVSPSGVNSRIAEQRSQWIEDCRRRAEERKRRIEAENRRDRERGFMEYTAMTSGSRIANAASDHWKATEGIRNLKDNYHAVDMAQPPQQGVTPKIEGMSGNNMAGIIKSKENGSITLVQDKILKSNQSFKCGERMI